MADTDLSVHQTLIDRKQLDVTKNFQIALQHIITASQQAKDAGNEEWWRPLEAGLAAVGSQSEAILECVEDEEAGGKEKPIDIDYILLNVIPSILTLSGSTLELKSGIEMLIRGLHLTEHQFLQGRAFVFASQFSQLLQAQSAGQYLEAAVQVIESPDAGVPVKISAVKAVQKSVCCWLYGPEPGLTLILASARVAMILFSLRLHLGLPTIWDLSSVSLRRTLSLWFWKLSPLSSRSAAANGSLRNLPVLWSSHASKFGTRTTRVYWHLSKCSAP